MLHGQRGIPVSAFLVIGLWFVPQLFSGVGSIVSLEWITNRHKEAFMSIAKVTEIIASSTESFDDAIKIGVARAQKTLKHLKSAWVQNQQIKLDDEGRITEYRVQLKITFILED